MRDQIDSHVWTAHHQAFSAGVDRALAGLAAKLPRLRAGAVPAQLIAATAAVGLTLVTFTGAAA
ncbi:MAG: hypothetical protein ACK40O_13690 [Allosphingosinicella sp.]